MVRNQRAAVARSTRADPKMVRHYRGHARLEIQEDVRGMRAELAHMTRVMTMGELTASIAHEVNQPLAAIIASGDSCAAWLNSFPPNLDKARAAASRMIQA